MVSSTRRSAPASKAPTRRKTAQAGVAQRQEPGLLQPAVPGSSPGPSPKFRKAPSTDWEAIERDYRTGKFTVRELEAKHGPSYSQISRRAKKEAWTKDLRDVIREATSAAIIRETVATAATGAQQDATNTVQAAAEVAKQVILGHRSELRNARNIAQTLLQELADATLADKERAALAAVLAGADGDGVDAALAQSAIEKMLGLRSRVNSLKALAEALGKLQAAERVAFDLDDDKGSDKTDTLAALLGTFQRSALPVVAQPDHDDGGQA